MRDLSFFFWSRHLWLRHTLASGTAPWWDPYVAGGQSAIVDALNQILMPITLAIRLLPSDVVSFNLWVALPLPFAALGMYLFLERAGKPASSAALGAIVVHARRRHGLDAQHPQPGVVRRWPAVGDVDGRAAEAGALGAPRGRARRGVCAAGAVGRARHLRRNGGRCARLRGAQARVIRPRTRALRARVSSICCGSLPASASAAPCGGTARADVPRRRAAHTAAACRRPTSGPCIRLTIVEAVAPHLFGNYYDAFLADIPWMTVLNSGRDPFFYSLYVGPLVLLLAATAIVIRPRRSVFWVIVACVFMVASFGGYTPHLSVRAQDPDAAGLLSIPGQIPARSACSPAPCWRPRDGTHRPTSTIGPPTISSRTALMRVARAAGLVALGLTMVVLVAAFVHHWSWNRAYSLAVWLKITRPDTAADFLLRLGPPLFGRAAGLLFAGAALLAVAASSRSARASRGLSAVHGGLHRSRHHERGR